MEALKIDNKNFYYPPGGILMWIIIFLELFTFGMALIAFVYYGSENRDLFHSSRMELNAVYGTINTVFLLSSGFFMVQAVHSFKLGAIPKASRHIRWASYGGLLFLGLKAVEYYGKIESGHNMDSNLFFLFYWLLTVFHLIHIIVGLVILEWTNYGMKKNSSKTTVEDVEAAAAFWHMCDLIWLLLFPILYLLY